MASNVQYHQFSSEQAFDLNEALTMPSPLPNISGDRNGVVAPDSSLIIQLADIATVTASNDVVCPVCMEGFQHHNRTGKQIPCGHVYHAACISPWLSYNNSCPLCRKLIINGNIGER